MSKEKNTVPLPYSQWEIVFIVVVIISVLCVFNYINCQVETVCILSLSDGRSVEFDCDIIYSRLGKYRSERSDYVYGSMSNIEMTACSYEIVGILREDFNFGKNITSCEYHCCVTDGTCYGFPPRGVNIQMVSLGVGEGE